MLFTLEALKLENEITAPVTGVVARVLVKEGATPSTQEISWLHSVRTVKKGLCQCLSVPRDFLQTTGFAAMTWAEAGMLVVALILLYLGIKKDYEPLLLVPIGFGMLLANLPLAGLMDEGGLLRHIYQGVALGIFPPLIFLGVRAMTDFGPLIANPKSILLGAAAQMGIFAALLGAVLLGFPIEQAASIGIIGGADGPTAIY